MLKKSFTAATLAVGLAFAANANALVLVNNWTLTDTGPTPDAVYEQVNSINISQAITSSYITTVSQSGAVPYIGQTFTESASFYSGDYYGAPTNFSPTLTAKVNLTGVITGLGSGISYALTGGSGSLANNLGNTLFNFTFYQGTGSLANNVLATGNNGSSLALFKITDDAFSEAALAGQNDLLWFLKNTGLYFQVGTTNQVKSAPVCDTNGQCTFKIDSDGDVALYRAPEPESLALLGLGLLGMGAVRRKTGLTNKR